MGVLRHFQQYFSYIWWSVLLVEETGVPGETTELQQITEILQRLDLYSFENKHSDARVIMYKIGRHL